MTIKRMKSRYNEIMIEQWFVDEDSPEFHSLYEVKEYCRDDFDKNRFTTRKKNEYRFLIVDTDEKFKIVCNYKVDSDGFDYILAEGIF